MIGSCTSKLSVSDGAGAIMNIAELPRGTFYHTVADVAGLYNSSTSNRSPRRNCFATVLIAVARIELGSTMGVMNTTKIVLKTIGMLATVEDAVRKREC